MTTFVFEDGYQCNSETLHYILKQIQSGSLHDTKLTSEWPNRIGHAFQTLFSHHQESHGLNILNLLINLRVLNRIFNYDDWKNDYEIRNGMRQGMHQISAESHINYYDLFERGENFFHFCKSLQIFQMPEYQICSIQPFYDQDYYEEVIKLAIDIFKPFSSEETLLKLFQECGNSNTSFCQIIRVNQKIVGFYLVDVFEHLRLETYLKICNSTTKTKITWPNRLIRGMMGVALGVHPLWRGVGFGSILKNLPMEYPKPIDYIFGGQLKTLDNKQHWLKRRFLLAEGDLHWYTMQIFSDDIIATVI